MRDEVAPFSKMLPRSLRIEDEAHVRFINKTDRMVELIWLHFDGIYVSRILKKDHFVDVKTYKNHPWIALDKMKNRLHIENGLEYYAKTSREYFRERYPDKVIPENCEVRIRANITLPLYTLKSRSLIEVGNHFRSVEDVDQLELPKSLAEKLKQIIDYRNSFELAIRIASEVAILAQDIIDVDI